MKLPNIDPISVLILMGTAGLTLALVFLYSIMTKAAMLLLSIFVIFFAIFLKTSLFKRMKESEDNAFPGKRY